MVVQYSQGLVQLDILNGGCRQYSERTTPQIFSRLVGLFPGDCSSTACVEDGAPTGGVRLTLFIELPPMLAELCCTLYSHQCLRLFGCANLPRWLIFLTLRSSLRRRGNTPVDFFAAWLGIIRSMGHGQSSSN